MLSIWPLVQMSLRSSLFASADIQVLPTGLALRDLPGQSLFILNTCLDLINMTFSGVRTKRQQSLSFNTVLSLSIESLHGSELTA